MAGTPFFSERVPAGDSRPRQVCDACGWIHYENPKVVVGAVATWEGRVLLCRRSIEPRAGSWTLPAGFLEQGESLEEGARREAREEACTELAIEQLLGIYDIPRISQVQVVFLAHLVTPAYAAGEESAEVALFDPDDIPWSELAFPANHWALRHHQALLAGSGPPPWRRTISSMDDLP